MKNITVPFEISLTNSEQPVICKQVVRLIPGKRLVAFGTWGDKPIVAKLFFKRNKAQKHAKRDIAGMTILKECNIPTPEIYYEGSTADNKTQVILFEKIETVEQKSRQRLLHSLIHELATQHVLGVLQKDLHFKNFLVTKKKIITLDGADIEKFDQPLSKKISLDNLALFIAQLGADSSYYRDELLEAYASLRGWRLKDADYDQVKKLIAKHQATRWANFQEKIFRNCSAFIKKTTLFATLLFDREYDKPELRAFLSRPEEVFTTKNIQYLKQGRSSTVIKTIFDGKECVIKRYNIKDFWHGLRRCLRPTRAAQSWRLSQYLCLMGIPTAKPIAFIEKRFLGFRTTSYFVMEYINGPHAGDYFSKADLNHPEVREVAKKTMALLYQLAQFKLIHGDLKMTNILIANLKPLLIDLDGMREYPQYSLGFKQAFEGETKRFLRNWENYPSLHKLFSENLSA